MTKPIIIVGGDIAGLCAGIALQRLGLEAIVYERNPEPTVVGAGIIIAPNAIQALGRLKVAEKIMDEGYESNGFHMLTDQGKSITKMLVPNGFQSMYAIHRSELHRHLLEALKPGTVKWGKKCDKIELGNKCVKVHFHDHSVVEGALLIAADGIHSTIRKSIYPETKYRYALVNAKATDPILAAYSPQDLYERFRNYHDSIPHLLENTPTNRMIHRDVMDIEPMEQCYVKRLRIRSFSLNVSQANRIIVKHFVSMISEGRKEFLRYQNNLGRSVSLLNWRLLSFA